MQATPSSVAETVLLAGAGVLLVSGLALVKLRPALLSTLLLIQGGVVTGLAVAFSASTVVWSFRAPPHSQFRYLPGITLVLMLYGFLQLAEFGPRSLLRGGPLTLGRALHAIRTTEEISMTQFAKRIGVSVQHLSDVEKDRRGVSAERAAKWAKRLGHPPPVFVQLAPQQQIDAAGLRFKVIVEAA